MVILIPSYMFKNHVSFHGPKSFLKKIETKEVQKKFDIWEPLFNFPKKSPTAVNSYINPNSWSIVTEQ